MTPWGSKDSTRDVKGFHETPWRRWIRSLNMFKCSKLQLEVLEMKKMVQLTASAGSQGERNLAGGLRVLEWGMAWAFQEFSAVQGKALQHPHCHHHQRCVGTCDAAYIVSHIYVYLAISIYIYIIYIYIYINIFAMHTMSIFYGQYWTSVWTPLLCIALPVRNEAILGSQDLPCNVRPDRQNLDASGSMRIVFSWALAKFLEHLHQFFFLVAKIIPVLQELRKVNPVNLSFLHYQAITTSKNSISRTTSLTMHLKTVSKIQWSHPNTAWCSNKNPRSFAMLRVCSAVSGEELILVDAPELHGKTAKELKRLGRPGPVSMRLLRQNRNNNFDRNMVGS